MNNFSDKKVMDFVNELASGAPAPGGGGCAALTAALGIALGNMVSSLTIGKKKYADVEGELIELKASAEKLQTELLELIDKDAQAFYPLSDAYRMPAGTEEEKEMKDKVLQSALSDAAEIPLEIMRKCAYAIELLEEFAEKGSKLALSDAACGAITCKAALRASWINVCVNTNLMKDEELKNKINSESLSILDSHMEKAEVIYGKIEKSLI